MPAYPWGQARQAGLDFLDGLSGASSSDQYQRVAGGEFHVGRGLVDSLPVGPPDSHHVCAYPPRQGQLLEASAYKFRPRPKNELVHLEVHSLVGHFHKIDHRRPQDHVDHPRGAYKRRTDDP